MRNRGRNGSRAPAARRVIGLDVGERRTKVAVVEGSSTEPRLVAWSDEPTPPGLVVSGRPARPSDLAAWLRRVLADRARPGDPVWTACPWTDAQVKRLSVADAGNREATLRGLSVNPAFRTSGADAAPWRLDYHVIDPGAGAVMAVAVRPDGFRALTLAASAAGADVRGVSVTESAVVHAWLATSAEPEARAVLVECGHNGVTLVVVDGGEPVGFRRVMFGGRALEERGAAAGAEAPPPLVEEWSGRIAQEVRMVAGAAFRGTGAEVPRVVVMGGLGKAGELVGGLAAELASPVEQWDGGRVVVGDAGDGAGAGGEVTGLGVALGLAVQGLAAGEGDGVRGPVLQLLRDGDGREAREGKAKPGAIAKDPRVRIAACALVVAALALQAAEVWLSAAVRAERSALVASQVDSVRVRGDIDRLTQLEGQRGRLGDAAERADRIRAGSQAWPYLMDRVSRAMPESAWSDSMVMDTAAEGGAGVRFRLRGYAGTGGQVADLERRLRGGGVTETAVVSLSPVPMAGLTLIRWTLEGRVAGAALPNSPDAGYRQQTVNEEGGGR